MTIQRLQSRVRAKFERSINVSAFWTPYRMEAILTWVTWCTLGKHRSKSKTRCRFANIRLKIRLPHHKNPWGFWHPHHKLPSRLNQKYVEYESQNGIWGPGNCCATIAKILDPLRLCILLFKWLGNSAIRISVTLLADEAGTLPNRDSSTAEPRCGGDSTLPGCLPRTWLAGAKMSCVYQMGTGRSKSD